MSEGNRKQEQTPEIPPGLKERWEEFSKAAKECWRKAPEEDSMKRMASFWNCMEKEAGKETVYGDPELTQEEARRCKEMGYPVEPHPICVLAKESEEGLNPGEAAQKCLEEGKYHGISALACKLRLEEHGEEPRE